MDLHISNISVSADLIDGSERDLTDPTTSEMGRVPVA